MMNRVSGYVGIVCVAAGVAAYAVHGVSPAATFDQIWMAAYFGAVALLAAFLSYPLPRAATGTIVFVAFLASVLVSPTSATVLAVALAKSVAEIGKRRQFVKGLFNVAQDTAAVSASILVFVWANGLPLAQLSGVPIVNAASVSIGPASAAVATYFVVNSALVSGVIAVSEGRNVLHVWRQNTLGMLAFDAVASPVIFLLAWVFVKSGPIGALALALPMLGIRQLYKANADLTQVNQDLLELMVKAIEARDSYTSGHSRRVSHYAEIIARALGMSGRQIERIGTAALLHDIGKIHEVFASILRKPGRLTPQEWFLMQTHPAKGAELVGTVSHLRHLMPAVRHHHENWDGTGYPDGLAGDKIPIESRIIIFADMIDAMTTDRPYRKALGEGEVRAELIRCRGRQFDPDICDRLLASPMFSLLFQPQVSSHAPVGATLTARASEGRRVTVGT